MLRVRVLDRKWGGISLAGRSLIGKLKLKPGQRAALVNQPQGYLESLGQLPEGVQLSQQLQGVFDWVQVFIRTRVELDEIAPRLVAALKPESLLWISFPKGTSKIQTDLTRDQGWESLEGAGLKWTNLVSIDGTWSAFSLRPYKPGEKRQSFR